MAIHIGELIRREVELKKLTYKEFGALIHRNEKTIPDIYDRASMSIDLLITISAALKKDFLNVYYTEEPLKSLLNDEMLRLNTQLEILDGQVQKLIKENESQEKELTLTRELNDAQKDIISFAKAQIEDYKIKVKELTSNTNNPASNV